MRDYNYYEAVQADVREYIEHEVDRSEWLENRDGLEEHLNEELWTVDSVTGNGSGSYTFNTYEAEENICHNLDLLAEAVEEFGGSTDVMKDGAEACDVTIRCYLLGQSIAEVLDELESEGYFEESDENGEEV